MLDLLSMDSPWIAYGLIPLLIALARVLDVSIGTIRIVYLIRGHKALAAALGFFESLVWLLAVAQIMRNLTNLYYYLAFASGFALGNFVGLYIEEKLAIGTSIIRIITGRDATDLVERLNDAGYGVTHVDARGRSTNVKVIFSVVKRDDLPKVLKIVKACNPTAFYTVEDVQKVREGVYPTQHYQLNDKFLNWLRVQKKK